MEDLPPDSRERRLQMLVGYGLALAAVALTVLILSIISLTSKQADHLAVIANFLALGTLALALIAGFVALQAYAAATGLPDLQVRTDVWKLAGNRSSTVQKYKVPDDISELSSIEIFIRNKSNYSARNPVVIVHFIGFPFNEENTTLDERWTIIDRRFPYVSFQWDGGPMRSIHGYSTRALPPLSTKGFKGFNSGYFLGPKDRQLTFELLADGYRRSVYIPIDEDENPEAVLEFQ